MISIITISKNNTFGLQKTIESVRSQIDTAFEFIVIDGGSSDDSIEVLEKNNDLIDFWVSESDSGVYDAMNKGLFRASSDYCVFMNAGDTFYESEVLKRINNETNSAEILYGDACLVWSKHNSSIKIHPKENIFFYLTYEMICHQAIFFRTSFLKECKGFNQKYRFCADYDLLLKSSINPNISFKKLNFIVCNYDMNGISNSKENADALSKEKIKIMEEVCSKSMRDLIVLYRHELNLKRSLRHLGKVIFYEVFSRFKGIFNFG